MIKSLLQAVTKQLGKTFGDSYRYYTEDIEQGLRKPCFVVKLLKPTQRSTSPTQYTRTIPIVVHYFSDSKDNRNNNAYEIHEQVIDCLELLPFKNGVLRSERINSVMVDGVLEIFPTYTLRTVKDEPIPETMVDFVEVTSHTN